MFGDWVFLVVLTVIFIIFLVLGIRILNSTEDITPSLRKADPGLDAAYTQYRIAGYLSFWTGIAGLILAVITALVLIVTPVGKLWYGASDLSDAQHPSTVPLWLKTLLKIITGLLLVALTLLIWYELKQATISLQDSRTYKLSRGNSASLNESIKSSEFATNLYLGFAIGIAVLFVLMIIYDQVTKTKTTPTIQVSTVEVIQPKTAPGFIDLYRS